MGSYRRVQGRFKGLEWLPIPGGMSLCSKMNNKGHIACTEKSIHVHDFSVLRMCVFGVSKVFCLVDVQHSYVDK